jgi:hypothetical protein
VKRCIFENTPDTESREDPRVIHANGFPDRYMEFEIKPAIKLWIGSSLPQSCDTGSITVAARAADDHAKVTFSQASHSTLFMDALRKGNAPPLVIGVDSFEPKSRYDAPWRFRRARWILSQLWTEVFNHLPQFPKPVLQVDSLAFTLLLGQDAKTMVFFEVLLADRLDNPVVINLGGQFALSGLEMDLGRVNTTRDD